MQKKILNCEKLIKLVLIENIMRIKNTNAPHHIDLICLKRKY